MIIVDKYCLLDGSSASSNYSESVLEEQWYIKYDTVASDPNEAIRHSGFFVGEEHQNNVWFSLQSISAEAMSGQEWIVSLTYTTRQTDNNGSDVDFKTDVQFSKWTYQRVVYNDKETGVPIVNKAGQPFDSPVISEIACPVVSVTRRRTAPNMEIIQQIGSINSGAFTLVGIDIPKYCAQLSDYRIERGQDQDGNAFYTQTFEFKLNFKKSIVTGNQIGFKEEIANTGYRYTPSSNAPQPIDPNVSATANRTIYDIDGSPITTPVFISPDGTSPRANPNYLQFVVNDLNNFASFNLPTRYPNY